MRHVVEDGRELSQRLHAGIPRLLVGGLKQGIALQPGIVLHPLVGGGDLVGKGRTGKHLRYQRVGIERNWRDQVLDLFGAEVGRIGIFTTTLLLGDGVSGAPEECGTQNDCPNLSADTHFVTPVRRASSTLAGMSVIAKQWGMKSGRHNTLPTL